MIQALRSGREDGAALTETAVVLPVLVATMLWSIYMWDIGKKKVKLAEAAQYAAWEMVGGQGRWKDTSGVAQDVKNRYADLDSSTAAGAADGGVVDFNGLQVEASLTLEDSVQNAPVNGAGGLVGDVVGAVTKPIFESMVGDRFNNLVVAEVSFKVKNRLLPPEWLSAGSVPDPLVFTTKSAVIYDTWAAWKPGQAPAASGTLVRDNVEQVLRRSNGKVVFPLLGDKLGSGSTIGNILSAVTGALNMPWFLDISPDQIRYLSAVSWPSDVLNLPSQPTSMPGKLGEPGYWTGNGTETSRAPVPARRVWKLGPVPGQCCTDRCVSRSCTKIMWHWETTGGSNPGESYSTLLNDSERLYRWDVNRFTRSEACRGYFFEGSLASEADGYQYRIDGGNACRETTGVGVGQRPYTVSTSGTRKGLKMTSGLGIQIETK